MHLTSARELALSALSDLFNDGFSGYVIPVRMTEQGLRDHLQYNDIDLGCSRVATVQQPVAFALIGVRGQTAWVGGMGTSPARRREGIGEHALLDGLNAAREHGCSSAWLEVIDSNKPAIALYEKLGFRPVRDLITWSLPAAAVDPVAHQQVEPERALDWIAAHRRGREPWQRAAESLANLLQQGVALRGLVIRQHGETTAGVVYAENEANVRVLQVCALDDDMIGDVLCAASGGRRDLYLSNAPAEEPASRILERLGAQVIVRQHEMRLSLLDAGIR